MALGTCKLLFLVQLHLYLRGRKFYYSANSAQPLQNKIQIVEGELTFKTGDRRKRLKYSKYCLKYLRSGRW
jgi:hypothetical protein